MSSRRVGPIRTGRGRKKVARFQSAVQLLPPALASTCLCSVARAVESEISSMSIGTIADVGVYGKLLGRTASTVLAPSPKFCFHGPRRLFFRVSIQFVMISFWASKNGQERLGNDDRVREGKHSTNMPQSSQSEPDERSRLLLQIHHTRILRRTDLLCIGCRTPDPML